MNTVGVIVGTGIGGQSGILRALHDLDIPSVHVAQAWVRDHYVHAGPHTYVRRESPEGKNPAGTGGELFVGDSYVIVRNTLGNLLFDGEKKQDRKALAAAVGAHYSGRRVHVLSALECRGRWHYHIDMSSMHFPQSKLFIADTYNGGWDRGELEHLADAEHIRVRLFDGESSGVWHPLNGLTVPTSTGEAAVIDSKAHSLRALLENEGIAVGGAIMPQHEYPAGKIHCQTNTFDIGDDYRALLEKF